MNINSKYIFLAALLSAASTTYAQDSYDAQTMANSDLNGTARFVAMGGALGALGGDISVMSTNPAGTAMYRKSDAAISFSGVFSGDGAMGHDGSRMSLDQGGILIAFDMDNPSSKGLQYVNFGVNYQKKRNFLFNQLTDVQHLDNTFSQTYQIADLCNWAYKNDYWGTLADMSASKEGVHGGILDESGEYGYAGVPASKAYYERATYGGNVQADLNLSFNLSDQVFLGASVGVYDIDYSREYDYHFRTPWKFGVSLGHTVGKNFAIGAEYEFQDMGTAKYSEVDGYNSSYFRNMNNITKETLRGQHTLKVGAEYKPVDAFSIRLGYNYVSSPFKKDAFRTIGYDGPYTETDYTNWGDTHRFTCGVGYRYKGGYIDVAYQYQAQKGDFYAFDDIDLKPTKIDANRSQLMATFGFRF